MFRGRGSLVLDELKRKIYGVFETPREIFRSYILPRIRGELRDYLWVDLFCGEGNLILPILEEIPVKERVEFFREHIMMFDVLPEMVERAINNAVRLGIPREVAEENILVRDVLKNYPREILDKKYPVYHVTNPPYMYIGYIKKRSELRFWLEYFDGENKGYQDLYQLALINDLRHGVPKMIYVIPTNFLYGSSVSNKIRRDFLFWYEIKEAIIFEKRIFEFTGQHVGIFFFERKQRPIHKPQRFRVVKINEKQSEKIVTIKPSNMYRAGDEFSEFVERFRARVPLKVKFYLFLDEVLRNPGGNPVIAVDSNNYDGRSYKKRVFYVNNELYERIRSNILFVKTIDGVRESEKAGLYVIREVFDADCIVVSKAPYRTHPIQLFFYPQISVEDQLLLKDYFNLILNHLRELTDSEFMTTYKYSETSFTRKYLGLTQVKKIIETFPILELDEEEKEILKQLVYSRDVEGVLEFLNTLREDREVTESTPRILQ